ncbi:PaaI family thioesterase [Streptomyces sp. NPDC056347]|uniref:PaaI family thioesterase n=1 Tax=unclassified Streptomyces TaxID=2593676 RepID=UPI0035D80422
MNPPYPEPGELLALMPFAGLTGVEVESAGPDEVVARLPWAAERCTAGGVLHGGALVTLADAAAGICAYLSLPDGASTSTIELKTNFFSAVRGGAVVAVARPLHRGASFIVVQTDLYDHRGRAGDGRTGPHRVAQTTQTQAVLRPRG